MSTSASRLGRLLALVPYLVAHPGVSVTAAAEVFGITEDQLRADLELLFLCGLPGYTPGDLIDVTYEGDRITVSNADAFARPLRLTPDEALALVVAARSLSAVPGLQERDALTRAIAKLESALGPEAEPSARQVTVALDPEGETLERLQGALEKSRRVRLRYHSAGRDEVTEREVDPMRLVSEGGRWYLEAWCRRVDGVRLFRLDRVMSAVLQDVPSEVPADAVSRDLAEGLFQPRPDDTRVILELDRSATWVSDYYPCEETTELPGGGQRVALRARDLDWLRRLALRLGHSVVIVSPLDLAEDVRRLARAAYQQYAEPAD